MVGTGLLFLISLIGLYVLGRFTPQILNATLQAKAGASFICESNGSNLIFGNLELKDVKITSPERWKETQFLNIKTFKIELNPWTFIIGGSRHFKNVELDIERIVLVGKADYLKDNNAQDILKGLKSGGSSTASPARDYSSVDKESPRPPFKIDNLKLRVGKIIIIVEEENKPAQVIVNNNFNFAFEANDITEKNYQNIVSLPLGAQVLTKAVKLAPRLMMDITDRNIRRSITEKFIEIK